ncbi:DUF4252 domain-containing protein [Flavobacterium sp. MAH-1]|uniref:DUF4252 domain-containing protein n=1 Tax=Flavobacterium agri TaxID=2743471 RepID=A0A7Y8Y3M7_9FLAO|nr:DUF4252 domain-containing protein [Flavobacterium agri]NUY81985.1 DUF4252 domain-containing protein [Flavobacterium agri]NYA72009.1 DUF4252 domain-containing protein [Flavobacterium agri]
MKKLILTVVLALMPSLFFAQTAFDKFDGQDDVTAVVVNKKMFKMMGDVKSKENQQYLNLIKKLDNLRVFTTQSTRVTSDMKATSEKYIKTAGLEELMRVTEKGQNIKILVKSGTSETNVKELLMFIEGSGKNETVLMSLTGDFDLNDISMLTDKLNLPGGANIDKAAKGSKGPKGPKGPK